METVTLSPLHLTELEQALDVELKSHSRHDDRPPGDPVLSVMVQIESHASHPLFCPCLMDSLTSSSNFGLPLLFQEGGLT